MTTKNYSGDLAYLDTFQGLIPCKVLAVRKGYCDIQITATRGAYIKGEIIKERMHTYVIPRASVHVRNGRQYIRNNYLWIPD